MKLTDALALILKENKIKNDLSQKIELLNKELEVFYKEWTQKKP